MAIAFQAADDYLDDDTDGKGLLASNTQVVKNGEPNPTAPSVMHGTRALATLGCPQLPRLRRHESPKPADGWTGRSNDTDGDGKIDLKSETNFLHSVYCAERDRDRRRPLRPI